MGACVSRVRTRAHTHIRAHAHRQPGILMFPTENLIVNAHVVLPPPPPSTHPQAPHAAVSTVCSRRSQLHLPADGMVHRQAGRQAGRQRRLRA